MAAAVAAAGVELWRRVEAIGAVRVCRSGLVSLRRACTLAGRDCMACWARGEMKIARWTFPLGTRLLGGFGQRSPLTDCLLERRTVFLLNGLLVRDVPVGFVFFIIFLVFPAFVAWVALAVSAWVPLPRWGTEWSGVERGGVYLKFEQLSVVGDRRVVD